MNIKEFSEKACTEIAKILGKEVRYQEVDKLNGSKHHGIMIHESGNNITPTMYLETFYNMYLETEDWKDTLNRIITAYQSKKFPKCLDMEWFEDFEKVQGLIFHKLINLKANTTLLADVPHTRYLDFAIIYCVRFEDDELGYGSILIHNNHLERWNCTTQDLARLASENTPQLYPLAISNMKSVLQDFMGGTDAFPLGEEDHFPMYIMSNTQKVNGATAILYKDALKGFADSIHSDVVILPSSVHEVILLSLQENDNVKELRNMVYEVNRSELAKEDFLSDNVYLYRRDTGNIEIV